MNRRTDFVFVVTTVVLVLVAAACAPQAPPPATEVPATEVPATEVPATEIPATEIPATEVPVEEKVKVAVLFPGVVTDDSWNQRGYEGLVQAEKECGVEIAYTEEATQDEQVEIMRTYAAEGYDIIIGHGGEYIDAAETVGSEYPDVQFVVTNGMVGHDNVSSIRVSYRHEFYLIGALACEVTESNKVAVVVGEPLPAMEQGVEGLTLGAQTCGKDVEVEAVYTASWADVQKAREASLALIADGVDVLTHLLDAADAGVLSAAEDEGVMAIGAGKDQRYLAPDAVVGSGIARYDLLVYEAACGNVPMGEVAYQDATNHITIQLEEDRVPEDVRQRVLEKLNQIKSGEIELEP
jgi:basic membrane protein A